MKKYATADDFHADIRSGDARFDVKGGRGVGFEASTSEVRNTSKRVVWSAYDLGAKKVLDSIRKIQSTLTPKGEGFKVLGRALSKAESDFREELKSRGNAEEAEPAA